MSEPVTKRITERELTRALHKLHPMSGWRWWRPGQTEVKGQSPDFARDLFEQLREYVEEPSSKD